MDVLITGVNGFLGRNIATILSGSGHKVIGIDIAKTSKSEDVDQYHSASILDQHFLTNIVKEVDVIIHLAAITAHSEIVDNSYETLEINLDGTKSVLNAFKASKKAKKFIYASTGKVYGKIKELPLSEESVTDPLNILGKSKLIAERLIDFYSDDEKSYVIFRIFQAYGAGQIDHFLIPTIIKQLDFEKRDSQTITLGDISAQRDYIYIEDIANAFSLAISSEIENGMQIYNLSTGVPMSAQDIVHSLEALFSLKVNISTDEKLLRTDEESIEYGSYSKAESILGWKPKVSIKEGLIMTVKEP